MKVVTFSSKMDILKITLDFLFAYSSFLCSVKGTRKIKGQLVECCVQCIASPVCNRYLYSSVEELCVLQGGMPDPSLFRELKYYSLVQFQKFGYDMFQYHSRSFKVQNSRRLYTDSICQSTKATHSLKTPNCPEARVRAFHQACQEGNLVEVKTLVCGGLVDVDCREKWKTALMIASQYHQEDIFDFLVQQRSDLTAVDDTNDTVLHYACYGGSLHIVKYLLNDTSIDMERKDARKETPLMLAVREDNILIVKLLKNRGANLMDVDEKNQTILHIACVCGHLNMVKNILSLTIFSIESKAHYDRTPLMSAVGSGQLQVVKYLKRKGSNLKVVDSFKCNILHLACIEGKLDVVKYILSLNIIDIESRGPDYRTPLMSAAAEGKMPVVKYLKDRGADLKAVNKHNDNILHLACILGRIDTVKYILSLNIINIESRELDERTPLMAAVANGQLPIVKLLKDRGANTNTVNKYNNNILHLACFYANVDMVEYILSLNVSYLESRGRFNRTPLMAAVGIGRLPVVKYLKERGADLKVADEFKHNILHLACFAAPIDMVKYILSLNVIDIESRRPNYRTPVMEAAAVGKVPVVQLLEDKGADLKVVTRKNNNILHLACIGGHVDMVEYILSLKIIDIDSRGRYHRTPLMKAVGKGRFEVVKLLKDKGADLKLVDEKKNNILHMACIVGHVDMVKYILSLDIIDIESRGRYYRTPMLTAVAEGKIEVVKYLKDRGANLKKVDDYNNNILDLACRHSDMVEYVRSHRVFNARGRC